MPQPVRWATKYSRILKKVFKKKDKYKIAIVGATGIVGESLLDILHSRNFPSSEIDVIASSRSVDTKVKYGDQLLSIVAIDSYDFSDTDIAFFSAGSEISKKYVPEATKSGTIVIDNTSEFRYIDNIQS